MTIDRLAAIRRLYYTTTRETIHRDLARAIQLLKTMETDEERQRAAVYLDGLAEMRSEWGLAARRQKRTRHGRDR